ncbi:MAG: SDR family oxidoreductase [Candidatus Binatia bacterium]
MASVHGKVAVITGAGSGIGRATTLLMASRGACVTVADLDDDRATAVAAEIRAAGGRAIHHTVDVSREDEVRDMIAATVAAFGGVDILHNNAGEVRPEPYARDAAIAIETMEVAHWDHFMNVNLKGAMLGCKWAIPEMLKRGGGVIVNTSSNASLSGQETTVAYGVSKGGVNTLTQYVATAYGPRGIRCNAVVPGLVRSPAAARVSADALAPLVDNILTPYVGTPEDIAYLVAFLASDEARYITGQLIVIDGGISAHAQWYTDMRRQRSGGGHEPNHTKGEGR